MTLDELSIGQKAIILKNHSTGAQKVRMMDMGVNKGVIVELFNIAPLGDPLDIKLLGYDLSMRKEDCKMIEVEVLPEENVDE